MASRQRLLGLAVRPVEVERKNRRTAGAFVTESIRVHRDEQIGIPFLRKSHAVLVVYEYVPVPDHHRLHAGLGVDPLCEFPADRKDDVLLLRVPTRGTRIVAAVARIDRDDDVPPRAILFRGALDRRNRTYGLQVDDEAVAIGGVGPGREGARAHRCIEIEDHAQLAIGADGAANSAHCACALGHLQEFAAETAVLEVDDEAIRAPQREDVVLDRLAQIENDARFVTFRPYTDIFHGRAGSYCCAKQQQERAG